MKHAGRGLESSRESTGERVRREGSRISYPGLPEVPLNSRGSPGKSGSHHSHHPGGRAVTGGIQGLSRFPDKGHLFLHLQNLSLNKKSEALASDSAYRTGGACPLLGCFP